MLEMKMTTDLQTALPAEIGFNFDELKAALTEQLHYYNTLVVTEETIQEGKEDRANLRKLREAIETRRKEVKRQCEQPYKTFEAKVKELVALIDKPIAAIDTQVKTFEEQQRRQKQTEIDALYAELVPDALKEIIPLQRIQDPKWLNKGTTEKSIREAIETRVKRTKVDLALIEGVQPQYLTAVQSTYMATLDINAAMDERDKIMAAEQAFQRRAAQQAIYQPPVEKATPVAIHEPVRVPEAQPIQDEKMYVLRLQFQLTMNQANALKQFLADQNIKYEKL